MGSLSRPEAAIPYLEAEARCHNQWYGQWYVLCYVECYTRCNAESDAECYTRCYSQGYRQEYAEVMRVLLPRERLGLGDSQ